MALRKRKHALTDGVATIAEVTPEWCEAGLDWRTPEATAKLRELRHMPFRRMMWRSKDVDVAHAEGFELSAKVSVMHFPGFPEPDWDGLVLMGGRLFEIGHAEGGGAYDYLLLSEVGSDGTVALAATPTTRDAHGIPVAPSGPLTVVARDARAGSQRDADAGSADDLQPTLQVTIRACDYAGQDTLTRGQSRYAVTSAAESGRWVRLTCERTGGAR